MLSTNDAAVTHLKHKANTQIARHLQSYKYLENIEHRKGQSPSYVGCLFTSSKKTDVSESKQKEDDMPISAMSLALEKKERQCEAWIDDFAANLNEKNSVPGHLVFQTFAPHDKEPLSMIFAAHSGSPK